MPLVETLGHAKRRTTFAYEGTTETGIVLTGQGNLRVRATLFDAALKAFKGKTIRAGFSMTEPHPDGLGAWIAANSKALNGRKLTSRHGSFIAAILVHEGRLRHKLEGNTLYLEF